MVVSPAANGEPVGKSSSANVLAGGTDDENNPEDVPEPPPSSKGKESGSVSALGLRTVVSYGKFRVCMCLPAFEL